MNQTDKINQINQTDQINEIDQTDEMNQSSFPAFPARRALLARLPINQTNQIDEIDQRISPVALFSLDITTAWSASPRVLSGSGQLVTLSVMSSKHPTSRRAEPLLYVDQGGTHES